LESYVLNYIETNITSEICRDYFKVAVCVTIYPPCTDNGTTVQQICSEDCDILFTEGTCAQESANIIEVVNDFVADPMIEFMFNCPNTSSFIEAYLNTSLCQYERCFVVSSTVNDSTNSSTTTTPAPIIVPDGFVECCIYIISICICIKRHYISKQLSYKKCVYTEPSFNNTLIVHSFLLSLCINVHASTQVCAAQLLITRSMQ